ncbi:auxin efflux carrier [Vararia minispora EC-137]|uniref:Auxin efflux carrier n=1 Tax=Vararia minispora EC-137 TaxID=1314806 RepID=A0ACB8QL15_9AGAM|nr:auxin efflux carrier [Vararia minispora EC-137]
MPCLLFSRMVPAFNANNMGAIGPLILINVLYGLIGAVMAWVIKKTFWVPHRFRHGLMVAGAWGNIGDIPTAVAQGITANAPFNGTSDENLAVAYIAVAILTFFVTFFPLGGHLLITKDFEGPDVESEVLIERMRKRRKAMAEGPPQLVRRIARRLSTLPASDAEKSAGERPEQDVQDNDPKSITESIPALTDRSLSTRVAREQEEEFGANRASRQVSERNAPSGITSATPTVVHGDDEHIHHVVQVSSVRFTDAEVESASALSSEKRQRIYRRALRNFFFYMLKPAPLSVLISLPIALIDPLKALFVAPDASFQPSFHPVAPDGEPPLAFVLDTATFAGNASVPLGLVCLGSALARLNVGGRENWARLPRGAIAALALGKMLLSAVVGVGIVIGFVHRGLLDANDKVLQFVCIILAGLPTATTQVYLTQIYNPTGSAEHVAAFLIPQYIIMPLSLTALCVYALSYLFPS